MQRFPKRLNSLGFTLIEVLVIIAIVGILAALMLKAVAMAREAARRVACENNMRQIGLGLHLHHDVYSRLPPGTERERPSQASSRPSQGYTAALLPFVEQAALEHLSSLAYRSDSSPFSESHNRVIATPIPVFSCPSDGRMTTSQQSVRYGLRVAGTSYLGVSGIDGFDQRGGLFGSSQVRFKDVTDGLSQTLLVGERPPSAGFDLGWWYAGVGLGSGELEHHLGVAQIAPSPYGDCSFGPYFPAMGRIDQECSANQFWSLHPSGVVFLRFDGSVDFMSYQTDEQTLQALATRSGEPAS